MKTRLAILLATMMLASALPTSAQPRRDNIGDIIAQYNIPQSQNAGLAWDGEHIWGCNRANPCRLYELDPENGDILQNYQIDQQGGNGGDDAIGLGWNPMTGELWVCQYNAPNNRSVINRYNRNGENLGTIDGPSGGHIDFAADGEFMYAHAENDNNNTRIYKLNAAGDIVTEGPNLRETVRQATGRDVRAVSITYVTAHGNAPVWLMSGSPGNQDYIYRMSVDWDRQTAEVVDQFAFRHDYPHQGLTHDGYDLWIGGTWGGTVIYKVDDGISESYGVLGFEEAPAEFGPVVSGNEARRTLTLANLAEVEDEVHRLTFAITDAGEGRDWLSFDPAEGTLDARRQIDVTALATTEGLEIGEYQRTVTLTCNDMRRREIELDAHILVVSGFGNFHGRITDAANNAPVEGAIIADTHFGLADTADADGNYSFDQLPAYTYTFRIVANDFLPTVLEDFVMEPGQDVERNFSLLHAEFTPSADAIDASLPLEDTYEYPLTIHNTGNGPLTWSVERVFPEGHVVDPWTRRQAFDAGASLNDDRIEGVAFDGTNFYLAGAAGADSSKIYVLNYDFEQVRSFDQLTHTRYGMKDLEWDGELLWGSGEQRVYGFNNEGDSIISFAGPFNPTNCIAYDSNDDVLWLSGTTTNISAYDREGNAIGRVLNRKGLRIYGLAYWPEDPDGYNLYIFDTPGAGFQLVHKMNTANGDTMLACSIPVENGESPTGSYICNDYDPYAWVMITMQNLAPANGGDRLAIWQLGSRTDWVQVSPLQDVVAAGDSKDVTVSFNSAGMPEDLRMEATLRFTHDGVGSVTEIPVAMNVTGEGGLTQRLLRLSRGWNLVSVNIDVAGAENFDSLLTPLVDGGLLVLAKDQSGNFYWPARGYNGIEGWDGLQSYWLKLLGDGELRLAGTSLAYDHELPLRAGWNCVSYLPRQPVEASVALSGLGENLVIARDGAGRFYLPSYGFSDIGQMREGLGYQLHLREDATLIYRLANRGASMPERYSPAEVSWLEGVSRTTRQHNLLVRSDLEAGTRLEAMTPSGLVAGRGVVGLDGLAGLTLWGDDPTTPAVDGFTEGEAVTISGAPLNSQLSTLNFSDGGWSVINLTTSSVPVSFGLSETYPNPFNGELRVVFGLTSSGEGRLAAYDLSGREVGLLWEGKASAGEHRIVWNAAALPSGVYLLRLESAGLTSTVKVVMVR